MVGVTGLIEREQIESAIDAALRSSTQGSGRVLVLEGAPGLGKTALLAYAAERARGHEVTVCAAVGGELEQGLAWGIARELLGGYSRERPELVHPAAAVALGAERSAAGDPVAAAYALTELCGELTSEAPLLLVVDDAHWADRMSASWLAYLAPRARELALLLLVAARPEDPRRPPELAILAGREGVTSVSLSPLSQSGASSLVRGTLPQASDALCRACQQASGGNPFLLAELLRQLRGSSVETMVGSLERLPLGGVDRAVARRLAAAGGDAQALAAAAAVLGTSASLARAADVAAMTDVEARAAALALRAGGILRDSADGRLRFAHPLLRSAVERAIPQGTRSALHLDAARSLDGTLSSVDRVAAHLLLVEPGSDAWIQAQLEAAGDAALIAGAGGDAVALYQRAAAERTDKARLVGLLGKLGSAALRFDPAAAEAPLRRALSGTRDPARKVSLALSLAMALQMLGRMSEAVVILQALGEDLAAVAAPRLLRIRVEAELLAQAFFDEGSRDMRRTRLAQAASELTGDDPEELLIVSQLAVEAVNHGTVEQARQLATQAWADGQLESIAGSLISPTVMWMPYFHMYVDDYQWTINMMEHWLETARRTGSAVLTAFAYAILAEAEWRAGACTDSLSSAQSAWNIASEFAAEAPARWMAMGNLAQTRLATGDIAGADALLGGHGFLEGSPSLTILMPLPRALRAEVLVANGKLEQGVTELEQAWAWANRREPSPGAWRFPAALVDGLLALGRREDASDVARRWLQHTRRFGAQSTLGMAQRAFALTQRGDSQIKHLRQAEGTLARSPARGEHARGLVELGAALRRAGCRREAREPLRSALDLATRCGATPLAERARVELKASGARPRSQLLTGEQALTPSERRVAKMAATGLTNREIANALFISRKTVERHLTNIYVKLETNDRSRLEQILTAT